MTKLQGLFDEMAQSPWLDNLRRDWIHNGRLEGLVEQGIRGITSNPTIFANAISGEADYDVQFAAVLADGPITEGTVEDAYWELVTTDIVDALTLLAPLHAASKGQDGFVSLEVSPAMAHETSATIESARALHKRISRPNLLVKIPATAAGVPAIEMAIGEGLSINVTLIFSLDRYDEVVEAYLSGLEACDAIDLSHIHSVASFFVSRVDTEVDRRLHEIGTPEAADLAGKAAVAQAQIAYEHFKKAFSGPRWDALSAKGAKPQRPLWASTSTKNPAYPDLLYVDSLIGPETVNTMPDATIAAFTDHGTLARTVDADPSVAQGHIDALEKIGIDMADVAETLEREGVASFTKSFDDLLAALKAKAESLRGESA